MLYLHIGYFKTGTSALQHFFATNRKLLFKNGVHYPKKGCSRRGAHYSISKALNRTVADTEKKPLSTFIDFIQSNISSSKDILISSEDFSGGNIDFSQLKMFHKLSSNIKIILYVRRQDEYVESAYSQRIKVDYPSSIQEFNITPKNRIRNDYFALCNNWAEVFGKDNIIVRVLEKSQLHQLNIFADFLNCMGLELTSEYVLPDRTINASLSADTLEYKRLVNNLALDIDFLKNLRYPLIEYTIKAQKKFYFRRQTLLSPSDRRLIIEKHAAKNASVANEYLGRSDGRLFYSPLPDLNEKWKPYHGLKRRNVSNIAAFISKHSPSMMPDLKRAINDGLKSDNQTVKNAAETLLPTLKHA